MGHEDQGLRAIAARCGRAARFGCLGATVAMSLAAPAGAARIDPAMLHDMMAAGLETILDKYIEALSPGRLVHETLEGLVGLDGAVAVIRRNDRIEIRHGDVPVADLPLPEHAGPDAGSWADVIVDGVAALHRVSDAIGAATVEDIYDALIDGALVTLDDHSRYAGRHAARRQRDRREGFGGIGIRYAVEGGRMRIERIFPGAPAARAGLRPGDVIMRIDGVSPDGGGRARLNRALRGDPGSRLRLTVRRKDRDRPFDKVLTRHKVMAPTVHYRRDGGIVEIELSGFNRRTGASIARALRRARRELGEDLKGVVLDLRGNPGGLLDQAVSVADAFLSGGAISSTRGRHPNSLHAFEATGEDILHGRPLAVLVNGRTASSSELVAAALQDRGRAVVIGSTTYGKGSVQAVNDMPNDGELTLTWSLIHAPSGYAFHRLGVHPTLCTVGAGFDHAARLEAIGEGSLDIGPVLSAWRRIDRYDTDARDRLRDDCPANDARPEADRLIARALLERPALYRRLLAIASATDLAEAGR